MNAFRFAVAGAIAAGALAPAAAAATAVQIRLLPPLVGSPDGLQLGAAPGEDCGRRTEGMSHSGFLVCRALMGR